MRGPTELQRKELMEQAMRRLWAKPRDPEVCNLRYIVESVAAELYEEWNRGRVQREDELFLFAGIVTEAINRLFQEGYLRLEFKDRELYYTPDSPLPCTMM